MSIVFGAANLTGYGWIVTRAHAASTVVGKAVARPTTRRQATSTAASASKASTTRSEGFTGTVATPAATHQADATIGVNEDVLP